MQPHPTRNIIISFRLQNVFGWLVTLLLCLFPVVLWFQIHPLSTVQGFTAIMLSLGRITGLVGLLVYALNLIYATRLRFLESLFGGLNKVYIAHHILGGFALILLAFHPLFLALRYATSSLQQAALLLLPTGLFPISALFDMKSPQHDTVLQQWAISLGSLAFYTMLGLLLITFFVKIPYRWWLRLHKWLGAAFFVAGLHIFFINSDTLPPGTMRWYILGFVVLGLLAFVYKTLAGSILIRRFKYDVFSVVMPADGVFQINMMPVGQPMPYKSGQFVFIRFLNTKQDGVSSEWHPFSISSGANNHTLQLSVKSLGDYTKLLGSLHPGAIAEVEGAYGKFSYTNFKNKKQIWIAGGIGITPFLSMAQSLPPDGFSIDLYYSVKTPSEMIDWPKLYDIAMSNHGNFRIIPFIAEQEKGFLSADYIEQRSGSVEGRDIFICGPPGMMQALRKQFRDKSVPATSIHSEEFAMS